LYPLQAFIDSSDRCIVVTASSYKAPFDLKIWVYQPPKAGAAAAPSAVYTLTVSSSSTWCDRIAIAFIVFLFMLLLLGLVVLVVALSLGDMSGIIRGF